MKTIKIIATGGTCEKEYDEIDGKLVIDRTKIPQLLRKARCKLLINLKVIKLIDSLNMDNKTRKSILEECKKSKERKIIIIHGTDSMTETAKILGKNIKNKTIVLTGSIIPSTFPHSDADFNLGCALSFAQTLEKGVYIAMNGKYLPGNNAKKVRELGIFDNKTRG